MRYLLLLPLFLLFSCTPSIEDAPFPADQQTVRFAFKRMSKHGQIEPVLLEGQRFSNWYFEVIAGDGAQVQALGDGSGIDYQVQEVTITGSNASFEVGHQVQASGEVVIVKREYPKGTISATLKLTDLTAAD